MTDEGTNKNTDSSPITQGLKFDHYRIVNKIGAGGMGEVWLAEDTELKRQVALKFLPAELCKDEDCRARFKREAQATAKLKHPNIVTIHEVSEFNGRPFFAMEHIEGETLREIIKAGKLTLDDAINFTMQICDGLSEAHEAGIVHRDIKPSNIIIDNKNRPRLLDFGLATIKGGEKLTKTGSTLGTIGHMSPEQVRGEEVDCRSDLFSVGVILYEMITGKQPFYNEYEAATMNAILNDSPEPLKRYKSDVPDSLQLVVDKVLDKDKETRYQTIRGILSDLIKFKKELKSGPSSSPSTSSIAVLPFTNMSADPEQEYFCDGVAEEIINALSHLENLRVVARTSCFAFKDRHKDIREIGRQLNVSTVLEGSVRKAGNRIRLMAQLINVDDGYHLWSEKFDRELDDVFAIQDEISLTIVNKLKVKLLKGEKATLVKRYTDNIEAYNLYLKGRFHWNKRLKTELEKAKDLFEKVIEVDPNYALAYTGLADCYNMMIQNNTISPKDLFPKAKEMALKALEIDNTLAEAHTSLASVMENYEWDFKGAEIEYKRAIELNPNYATAHQWYGLHLMFYGRLDEAINETKKARELDPLSPILGLAYAWTLIAARRYEEAEKICHQVIDDDSNFTGPNFVLATIYEANGEYDRAAREYLMESMDFDIFSTEELEALNKNFQLLGWKGYCRKLIDIYKQKGQSRFSAEIAYNYFRLDEIDLAFEWLEKAYNNKGTDLLWFRYNPTLDRVRSDSRFLDLIKKIGLE